MNNIKYLKLAAALALTGATVIGLSACHSSTDTAAAGAAAQGTPISAAVVIQKPIVETQEFSGRMEAIEHVQIRARVGGYITSVNFTPGSEVKKGRTLFVIDPRPYQAEYDRAEAAAAAARAKADLAKIELTRAQKLITEKAIPQRELDEKASSVKELDANARAAQAQYETAKLNLSYTNVTSPIDGRVSKAEITTGNLIDQSAILTSVVSNDHIYATFDGDEDTYLRVGAQSQKGKAPVVRVGLANETGFPHEGKLEFVDNQLNSDTGAIRLRAIFTNADKKLAPGLFVRVQLAAGNGTDDQTNALLINDRAVGTDQSRKFVFVVGADNKAEYRLVTLGRINGGLRIVQSGLKPGEKIVVNGLQRVRPGALLAPKIVAMDMDPDAPAAAAPAAKDGSGDTGTDDKTAKDAAAKG